MAFKKGKSKPKKKSAKGKRKNDDWSFDGGRNSSERAEDEPIKKPRGPRMTQERDERMRRSRLKIDENRKRLAFRSKMRAKVQFDGVGDEGEEALENIDPDSNHSDDDSAKIQKVGTPRNPLSFQDRLHRLLSIVSNNSKIDDGNNIVVDSTGFSVPVDNGGKVDDKLVESKAESVDDGNAVDIQLDVSDSEDCAHGNSSSAFDFLFSSSHSAEPEVTQSLNPIGSFEDLDIFSSSTSPTSFKVLKCLRELPILPKMWRSRGGENVGDFAKHLLPLLTNYSDALLEGRRHSNDAEWLKAIMLHAITHLVHARSKVLKHNQRLKSKVMEDKLNQIASLENSKKKAKAKAVIVPEPVEDEGNASNMRDQGFTRPRILILCPYRSAAFSCINLLREILGENSTISNYDKFVDEFGPPATSDDSEADDSASDDGAGGKTANNTGQRGQGKPDDWNALFHDKNVDDDFKMGIQVNPGQGKGSGSDKGAYVRLYSDFFISDIILASPLGLRLVLEKDVTGEKYIDALSSLEMIIVHQADVAYLQNWEHLQLVMQFVNRLPRNNHETDFSRVRSYFLDGLAVKHRQLVVTTAFNEPDIQAFFREHAASIAGKIRLKKQWRDGSIAMVHKDVNQVFQRVTCSSFEEQSDCRFQFFKRSILSQILRREQSRTLIVAPSYFDYVRIRNELIKQEVNAAFICEYSRDSEISRGRSKFFHGKVDILLYSGRAHFFRRFRIRGAAHLVFYSLPEYPDFYPEIVNFLDDSAQSNDLGSAASAVTLFTKYENMALERIVGLKRSAKMTASDNATSVFR